MPDPGETLLSPDGTLRVEFTTFEPRMSHWIYSPIVTHVPTGDVLLDLDGSMWDALGTFDASGRLTLEMRRYPGHEPGQTAVLDFYSGKVTIRGDEPGAEPGETTLSHFQSTYGANPQQLALARGRFILVKPFPLRPPTLMRPVPEVPPEPPPVEPEREPEPAPEPDLEPPPPAPALLSPSATATPIAPNPRPAPGQKVPWLVFLPTLFFIGLEYGGAWAIVAWTPVGRLHWVFAWIVALFITSFVLITAAWVFLFVVFRHYKGN